MNQDLLLELAYDGAVARLMTAQRELSRHPKSTACRRQEYEAWEMLEAIRDLRNGTEIEVRF